MKDGESQIYRTSTSQRIIVGSDLNLFDHLRVVYRYRWLIFFICVIATVTTGAVCYYWPPSFVASASIVPPMESSGGQSGLAMGLLGGSGSSLLRRVMDVSSVADMYVGIMQSRAVTDAIIDQFDLIRVYEVGARYKARSKLKAKTRITVSEEGIVYITTEDDDPNRSAALANAYVEELDKQNKRLSMGQATSKRMFLEGRLKEMKEKLRQTENIPSGEERIQEMLYELLMQQLEIAKIEEAKSMPTIQVLDPAVPPEQRKAKGTIRKAALAGIVTFICTLFFAFGREYYKACAMPRIDASYGASDRDERDVINSSRRPVTEIGGAHRDKSRTPTTESTEQQTQRA